ncbi:MAG: acyl-CoA dehydrogenase [Deltaproteobacteria bacterium]|nr:acyl-CoA dehydrogenase [Deltaproteobacteria bacterium]
MKRVLILAPSRRGALVDFTDSPSEAAFRAEAVAFLEAHVPEEFGSYTSGDDQEKVYEQHLAWQKTLAQHGWGALTWPESYGGRGKGPIEQIIWNEELSKRGVGHSMLTVGIGMVGPTLVAHGTPEQQERYLGPLLRADETWCQLFSEPGAGSDLAGLATRAVRDGDDWVVNGQKTWCSGAQHNDFGILIARTDPSLPKHKGITFFLLDMKAPGIEVRPLIEMTGESHFNEVFLNDVRVPDSARLGELNAGWAVAQTTLMNERMAMGGLSNLLHFDELKALVVEEAGGHPDATQRDELAKVYSQLRCLELLNARVVSKLGRGVMPTAESSVMKLALARVMTKANALAMRALGPKALLRPGYWQNEYLFAPAFHIAGGTSEVQKTVCAERVLGLPREESSDRQRAFEELPRS